MDEAALCAGGQDPDAEAFEVSVTDVVGGPAGLERIDAALDEAKRRH